MIVSHSPETVCEYWRAAICDEFEAQNSDPITTTYNGLGVVAWDDSCGQLVVGPETIFRSEQFPAEQLDQVNCENATIVVVVVATLVRCAPTVDDRGRPPSPEELTEAHGRILQDGAIVWNVFNGPLPDEQWDRTGVRQVFQGTEGGAVVVETRMTLGIPEQLWCIPDHG